MAFLIYYAATATLLAVYTDDLALALVAPFFLFFVLWPVVFLLHILITLFNEIFGK